jgi:hypothetical protein
MGVTDKLAVSLGRRDEVPNVLLAEQIAKKSDEKGIKELVDILGNRSMAFKADSIKTLYEVGIRKPELIAPYIKSFIDLLESKNNRLHWGAMTALSSIVNEKRKEIYANLSKIVDAGDKGSVITRDHLVKILVGLAAEKKYNEDAFELLIEQIQKSPVNQVATYIESTATIVHEKNKSTLIKAINDRLKDIEGEAKKKRLVKVLKKLSDNP